MAQFDVYRLRGDVLALDCQSDLLADLPTRFMVPLRPPAERSVDRLTPTFVIAGETLMMFTQFARGVDLRDILGLVANLEAHEYAIKDALDMLITGY